MTLDTQSAAERERTSPFEWFVRGYVALALLAALVGALAVMGGGALLATSFFGAAVVDMLGPAPADGALFHLPAGWSRSALVALGLLVMLGLMSARRRRG
ncbi:hypothetical protein F6X40_09730 [Paraburkholderia sp. UCT31]|uniref:hypothetical protein n=1 Tax=Paraburkholderia sp. UCT31 TaxID=2615209 RepID=UPI001654E564|nr:hypothetical protein [Paraburkholderia sp. UCT31]MBC8737087.1 hypothetical protein [Paraburkholderia sp. UCT31]